MVKKVIISGILLMGIVSNLLANDNQIVRVGIHNNPPLCSIDSSQQAEGIFVDILQLVADKYNWQIEYYPYNFSEAIDALCIGDVDLISTAAYTDERAQTIQFCDESIFTNWGVIYATKNSAIENISDLQNKRIALERGDIHSMVFQGLLDDFKVKANIIWCDSPAEIFQKLRNKEVDAGAVNKVFGFRQNLDHKLKSTSILFNPVEVRIAGGQLSNKLLRQIDAEVKRLKSQDPILFESIINQWLVKSLDRPSSKWIFIVIYVLIGVSIILLIVLLYQRNTVKKRGLRLRKEELHRLNSEKTIKQLEHEKTLILNSIDEQVVFMNTDYEIMWANNAFKKAAQKPFSELIGNKCHELYFNRSTPCDFCNFEKCTKTNRTESLEHFNPETNRYFLVKTHPVHNHDQLPIGFVEIISDITSKKHSEKQLIEAKEQAEKADYLKSAFLANMSHEIRTPMNAIIGFSELLEDDTLTNDEKKIYVGIIQSNGQQLLKLISDILVFSQIESGHIELQYTQFGVKSFLDSIYKQFKSDTIKHNKSLSIEFNVGNITPEIQIESDTVRLKQILYNLLTNAIKFTDKGSVTLGAYQEDNNLVFYVRDTGIGIPKAKHQDIFKRFSQVENNKVKKAVGSGLGLTIAHDLIKQLGGEIRLESRVNEGSTFYLVHPIFKETKESIQTDVDGLTLVREY